jgi:hypothetical protein
VSRQQFKGPESSLVELAAVKMLCIVTAAAALIAFVIATRASLTTSTVAAGLVPIATMVFIAVVLMPIVNDLASTRVLVAAVQRQNVPPEQITLYAAPYLWTRGFPVQFEHVVYGVPSAQPPPVVIVTARGHANEIAPSLAGFHAVDSVRMIGKWFDVYRR